MIAFVRGTLFEMEEDNVTIDCGSLGYKVFVPTITLTHQIGEEILLHTYQHVKEDGISLYGFLDKKQLEIFKLCISVSGIGPKSGLGIVNQLTLEQIYTGIQNEDYTVFTKVSGIGKKTAQRLVLELKDKIKDHSTNMSNLPVTESTNGDINIVSQAMEALTSLGYKRQEVESLVKSAAKTSINVSEIIKMVLKEKGLGGR